MANIHVEPKKQTSGTMWIWIVVVLVLAALIYFLVTRNRAADNTTTAPVNTTGAVMLPAPLFNGAVLH